MPSINRPNAPNRLPSQDFGDLFFKPRVLRLSEARGSATTPSPLSSPANILTQRRALRSSDIESPTPSSPLATSPGIFNPPRRPQHAERPSYRSDVSAKAGSPHEIPRYSSSGPYAIEAEVIPLKKRTSSESDRTRSVLGLSGIVHPSLVKDIGQPPHDAKVGFRWKRDFLSGWLEVRIGRQNEPGGRPTTDPDDFTPPVRTATTVSRRLSDTTTIADSKTLNTEEPLLPETPDDYESATTLDPLKEGLYCRTKRALGLKNGPITPSIESRTRTPTGAILDRVSSTLRFSPSRTFTSSTSAATSVSNLSIAAPRKKQFGRRALWHSSSSSVRDLLMGAPPTGTPEPEAMYTASDSKQYLSVDITQPDAPAFLPSEARRVNTPPLPSGTSGNRSSRGFFFDYNTPTEGFQAATTRSSSPGKSDASTPTKSDKTSGRPAGGDWYRVQLDAIDTAKNVATREDFVAAVPEHFPNSPLCPGNPKHKSGGTGTCQYHGRNSSTPSHAETTPKLGRTGTLSPASETWWLK